jgi:hypothetical protein
LIKRGIWISAGECWINSRRSTVLGDQRCAKIDSGSCHFLTPFVNW